MTEGARVPLITPAFLALSIATLAFFVAAGIVLPVAPQFAELALGADEVGVGLAIASFSIAAVALRPVVGWSADRFGRRPLLLAGALLTLAALGVHLLVADLAGFIAARMLLGAGEGFFFVAALAAGADLAPPERRGEAISFLSLSLYLGIAFGPPIGELVLGTDSFGAVWLVALAVAAVAAGLTLLIPETAPVRARAADGSRGPRPPLIHPAGLFPGLVILLGLAGMAGFLTFLPLHAPLVGLPDAGLPLTVYALIVVGLRVVGRQWPDRFGAARLSGVALAVSAVGLVLLGIAPGPAGLYAGTAIFAAGVAFTMPALLSLAVSRVPDSERGTVVGTATLFLDVAFGTAPVALGWVATRAGYGGAFVVAGLLAFVASGLLVARRAALAEPGPTATG